VGPARRAAPVRLLCDDGRVPETAAASAPYGRRRGRPGHDREAVLRRAVELFDRRGYDATSIGDLARELGVTKSAVFHHVGSKEALLAAALEEALDALERAVDEVAGGPGSAYDRLRAAVAAAVLVLVEHLPAVRLLLRVRGNSEVERTALERRRRLDERLAALVRLAAADGDLRDDVEPDLISRLLFGTVSSLVDWYRPGGPMDGPALAATVTGVLVDGLRRRP
jgi:AcrR family transcriptional regulator